MILVSQLECYDEDDEAIMMARSNFSFQGLLLQQLLRHHCHDSNCMCLILSVLLACLVPLTGICLQTEKAISLYCDDEKYGQAARIRKWIAENHESNQNFKVAIEELKLTCQYYRAAGMDDRVFFIEQKIAYLLSMIGSFEDASELYYKIGLREISNNLMKYSAHQSFFRSCLLLLAIENCNKDTVKERMEMGKQADFRFGISSSFEFLVNILDLIENRAEAGAFADHIYDFDEIFPFDDLELQLLETIYKVYFNM
jgi:hypothetical protein